MTLHLDDAIRERALLGAPLVVVLGYSDGNSALHPICAARVDAAMRSCEDGSVVVLSGWRRRRASSSEADLMRAAWTGPAAAVITDHAARATVDNAANAARLARALESREVRVVTSRWHRLRAALLFRVALRGTGARLVVPAVSGPWSARLLVREVGAYFLLPLHLFVALRR
jgi:uncharacterized SAM-binding protein YcdF (DUF218 family)